MNTHRKDTEKVRDIEDLRRWTGASPAFAVIGSPIAHSRSPAMHNAALAKLAGTDRSFADFSYFKFHIPPEQLAEAVPIFHEKGFRGLNLTLPHKVDVLPLLGKISPRAAGAGAVNTLVWEKDGYSGDNTDGAGFAKACSVRTGKSLKGSRVVIFGAGGAARAVASSALQAGCESLVAVNRDASRLEQLVSLLGSVSGRPERIRGVMAGAASEENFDDALLVNCTSLGLKPEDPSPVPAKLLRRGTVVYDTVYGSQPTALVREAAAAGLVAEDGLSMLCWQGALALELWLGRPVPVAEMWRAIGGTGEIL